MTKEPIMIDDVDVAECENLYTTNLPIGNDKIKCGLHQGIGKTCNDYPNCYYKQLKRTEQEYERLRSELNKTFEEKDKLHIIIDRLLESSGYDTNTASAEDFEGVYENMRYEKQQLDQLKAEKKKLKNKIKKLLHDCNSCNFHKYKQTLQEIKEIIFEPRIFGFWDEQLDRIKKKCEVLND